MMYSRVPRPDPARIDATSDPAAADEAAGGAVVLIPSYEPDSRLAGLVDSLLRAGAGLAVVVVDDGSGPDYGPIFDQAATLGAIVSRDPANRGKGAALKRGFALAEAWFPGRPVVCADSDGQHSVGSILRVVERLSAGSADMVLGMRRFTADTPPRSRFGNTVTRVLFQLSTGRRIIDTQTGLRGYPARMLPWLQQVPGERFEYELSLLLRGVAEGLQIDEVEIETIYLNGNTSSHFRTVADSIRVYRPLIGFSASSLFAFGLDTVLLLLLSAMTGNLLVAVAGARVISAAVNFTINHRLVFREGRIASLRRAAPRYFALAGVILVANYLLIRGLNSGLGVPLLAAKVITEITLFCASFLIQRLVVFRDRRVGRAANCRIAPETRAGSLHQA